MIFTHFAGTTSSRSRPNAALVLAVLPVHAELAEPDHTIYGTPTFFGTPVAAGVLTLVLNGQTQPIASYEMGTDPQLVGLYALRVPLDSVGDRLPSTARPGDRAKIFLDGQLTAEVTIGERGTVQLLDVDPELAPQPAMVSIADAAIVEDEVGPRGVELVISLSRALDDLVQIDWRTLDGTATAGADYQADSGQAILNPGETSATISIAVFDDALREADPSQRIVGETFQVELSQATEATLLASLATVTIVDDDTPPALAIGNLTVVEPRTPGGTVEAAIEVSLSHPWTQDIAVNYAAVDESATSAADFSLVPGRLTIPAGQVSAAITFEVFGDAEVESDETFRVELSNAAIASVLAGGGRTTILEEARLLTFVELQTDGLLGIDGLAGAIAVAASPDGAHVYAAGRVDDAVAVFDRDAASGRLEPVAVYREAVARNVGVIDALGGIEDVAVSPDGVHVVAAGAGDGESGLVVDGLLGATAVAFDPAGDHLYVAGSQDHAVAVFDRDAATGRLSFEEVVRDGAGGSAACAARRAWRSVPMVRSSKSPALTTTRSPSSNATL